MIQEIIKLLTDNQVVKSAIARNSKLNRFVQFYLHQNYKKLDSYSGSNCMSVMSSYLFPALLTYYNILSNRDEIFASAGHRISENVSDCFMMTCRELEKYVPDLVEGSGGTGNKSCRRFVENFIDKKASEVLRVPNVNMRSFWILAAIYYQSYLEILPTFVPNSENYLQLVPFSKDKARELQTSLEKKVNDFKTSHREGNEGAQKFEPHGMPESLYQTGDGAIMPFMSLAERSHMPVEILNNLARDLFAYSMSIESWENYLFWDRETGCLEYMPFEVASAALLRGNYRFSMSMLPVMDEESLAESFRVNTLTYVPNIHIFLRAIYNHDGSTTSNARHLLSMMRYYKRNSMHNLIAQRGVSIWR